MKVQEMTKEQAQQYYQEARESYEAALKVQLKEEAKYLSENGYVNEDESVPGSIAEIRNRKLREIAHADFWKNHQSMNTTKFKAMQNNLEYATRKLNEVA
jgi:hypothetical protein